MFSLFIAAALNAATMQASYAYEDAIRQFDAFAAEHGSMPMAQNPIAAVTDYRAKPEVVKAAEMAKLHVVCNGEKTTQAAGYDCSKVVTDAKQLKAASDLLRYSARIILQARYSTMDMHRAQGLNPDIQGAAPHAH